MSDQAEKSSIGFNWRDTAIGAGSSILVTVVGGAALWYLTYEPQAVEKLTYRLDRSATFVSQGSTLSFINIRVSNEGKAKSSHVTLRGNVTNGSTIKDSSVYFSKEPAPDFSKASSGKNVSVKVPVLLPSEGFTVSLLIDGRFSGNFPLSVRSDNSLGTQLFPDISEKDKKRFSLREVVLALLGILITQIIVANVIRFARSKKIKNKSEQFLFYPSLNNSGFILLHQGLIEDAKLLIEAEIKRGNGEQICISNYALCLALLGKLDEAESYMKAVNWLPMNSHERAVFEFNSALINYERGNVEKGWEKIQKASGLSPDIFRYAKNSVIVSKFSDQDARLQTYAQSAA